MASCPRHGFTEAQAGFDDSGKLRSYKKDPKRKYVRTNHTIIIEELQGGEDCGDKGGRKNER